MLKFVFPLLIALTGNLPAQTLLTRTTIPLGESPTQAGKLLDQGRTYTPFLFGFSPEGDILLADVYKNRIAVYTLEGTHKSSWEPGADYGPWISYFYTGTQRVLWGDARKLASGPLGGGQTSSLNLEDCSRLTGESPGERLV